MGAPARDGDDTHTDERAHAAGKQVVRESSVSIKYAELAVVVAAPRPDLPLTGEREHMSAPTRERGHRMVDESLDHLWPERIGAVVCDS